jgi:hypothetical protein
MLKEETILSLVAAHEEEMPRIIKMFTHGRLVVPAFEIWNPQFVFLYFIYLFYDFIEFYFYRYIFVTWLDF